MTGYKLKTGDQELGEYTESITVASNYVQTVFGQFDVNIKKIEKAFDAYSIPKDRKLSLAMF